MSYCLQTPQATQTCIVIDELQGEPVSDDRLQLGELAIEVRFLHQGFTPRHQGVVPFGGGAQDVVRVYENLQEPQEDPSIRERFRTQLRLLLLARLLESYHCMDRPGVVREEVDEVLEANILQCVRVCRVVLRCVRARRVAAAVSASPHFY